MNNQNPTNHRYITGIDGLRALSVIGVLLYHLNYNWLPGGFLGVTVFFVISGYLITDLLHTEWKQKQKIDLKYFWIRRFRRLLPALTLLLITVAIWVSIIDPAYFNRIKEEFLFSFLYINNWWYIYQEVSYSNTFGPLSPLTHIWSLAVEEQFYLFWPLLLIAILAFIKKQRLQVSSLLFASLVSVALMGYLYIPGTDPTRVYYGTDTRAFAFFLGAALAFILPSRIKTQNLTFTHQIAIEFSGVIGLLTIIGMFYFTSFYDSFIYRGGMLLLSVATLCVLIALLQPTSYLSKLLSLKPLLWVGTRSYGIYLWHFPIIILTTPTMNSTGSYEIGRIALQVMTTLIISELSYRYIENPIRIEGFKRYIQSIIPKPSLQKRRFITYTTTLAFASCSGILIAMANQTHENTYMGASYVEEMEKDIIPLSHDVSAIKTDEIEAIETSTKSITLIGDSILYDVAPYFLAFYPDAVIDYKVGRQMIELPDIIERLDTDSKLGDIIVIQIGTNGPFDKRILEETITSLGEAKKILLVNTRVPRPWQFTVNHSLFDVAQSYTNTTLVDWYSISENGDFFKADYVHLTESGAKTFANLLIECVEAFEHNLHTATIQGK